MKQRCRIEDVFDVRELTTFCTFTYSGQPLTVAELTLSSTCGGSGHSPAPDDAYLVMTNVGPACCMQVTRAADVVLDHVLPAGHTLVIDLAEPVEVSWSGPLHAVVAYLPRHAVFAGQKGLTQYSLIDEEPLDDALLGAIMACLRHTTAPSNPRQFELLARQLLEAACTCLARNHAVPMSEPRFLSVALSEEQRRAAIDYLQANLDATLSMHAAAAACGLSYRLFTRAFKLSLGASPHAWVMAARVDRAKRLMRDSSLRLTDIAQMTGFCDQSHFNRVFARFASCTPGEWRRKCEQEETESTGPARRVALE